MIAITTFGDTRWVAVDMVELSLVGRGESLDQMDVWIANRPDPTVDIYAAMPIEQVERYESFLADDRVSF